LVPAEPETAEPSQAGEFREMGEERGEVFEAARTIVLRQLAASPKSRHQLAQALRQRDVPDDVASAVLDRMTQVGLVDDAAYAATYVRSARRSRGLATTALAHEMRAKGIDAETAQAALDELDPAADAEQARALVTRRLRALHGLPTETQARRLAGMLARKGYPPDLARQVIGEAIDLAPEHQRD
jgi:regulatory protein